jgi:cellulose synthase/poly-beta-1,6-N-acetylglucosamine synthase-like glycosyltransferase
VRAASIIRLTGAQQWPGVSVIVPARNEAVNLPRLLASLAAQDYPLFEVFVVDDASTDATACIAREYALCSWACACCKAQGFLFIALNSMLRGCPIAWKGRRYHFNQS